MPIGNETIQQVVVVSSNPLKGVGDLPSSIVNTINKFLTSLFPKGEVYLVWAIAFGFAYLIKKRFKTNWIVAILFTIIIFGFLRWVGLG